MPDLCRDKERRGSGPFFGRALDFARRSGRCIRLVFMRPKVAVALLVALCVLTLAGSLFPQMPPGLDKAQQIEWETAARARYGARADVWANLGVFAFAASPLFLTVTGMLVLATTTCLVGRWRGLWRAGLDRMVVYDGRSAGDVYPLPASETAVELESLLSQALTRQRYRVRTEHIGNLLHLRADRYQWAHLGSLATHLAVPTLAIAVFLTSALATRHELLLGPDAVGPLGPTSDILLRNDGFSLLTDSEGEATQYDAHVTVIEDGLEIESTLLRVNRPLVVDGHKVYLNSYWGGSDAFGVALVVVRDPGYLAFVMAGLLLLVGVISSLWIRPVTVWAMFCEMHLTVWVRMPRSGDEAPRCLLNSLGLVGLGPSAEDDAPDRAESQ